MRGSYTVPAEAFADLQHRLRILPTQAVLAALKFFTEEDRLFGAAGRRQLRKIFEPWRHDFYGDIREAVFVSDLEQLRCRKVTLRVTLA